MDGGLAQASPSMSVLLAYAALPAPRQGEHHGPFGPISQCHGAGKPLPEHGSGRPPVREGERVLALAHVRDLPL